MANMTVGIQLDDAKVQALLKKAPEAVQTRLQQLIEAGAIDTQRVMRQKVDVGATGNLRRAIRYTVTPSQFKAEIGPGPEAPYALAVENGSRAHWTSVAPGTTLRRWADMKGINPYAVQRSIAKKGTKAHPYVEPTFIEMKPVVERDIAEGLTQLVTELNNGGL